MMWRDQTKREHCILVLRSRKTLTRASAVAWRRKKWLERVEQRMERTKTQSIDSLLRTSAIKGNTEIGQLEGGCETKRCVFVCFLDGRYSNMLVLWWEWPTKEDDIGATELKGDTLGGWPKMAAWTILTEYVSYLWLHHKLLPNLVAWNNKKTYIYYLTQFLSARSLAASKLSGSDSRLLIRL